MMKILVLTQVRQFITLELLKHKFLMMQGTLS